MPINDPPLPGLTLRRLELLVALADHGTVTAAARAEGLSQPALTQNLRALERHFELPLTTRVGRRVALTDAARSVVEYARRIGRMVDEAEGAVRDIRGLRGGRLAIGASTTPGTYLLPRRMGEYHRRHPGIELHLRIGDTREVEEWVLQGAVDFGVIGQTREQLGLVVQPFADDELVLVAPPPHPLATVRRLDGAALATHPLIVREPGSSTRETLDTALAARGLALRILFELGSTEAILQAVAAGLGASVVSALAVQDGRPRRGVRVRRVAGLDLTRYIATVTHPDAHLSPAAARFLANLVLAAGQSGG